MNFRPQNVLLTLAISVASFLIGTGCERDDVKVYHVETNTVASAPPATPTMAAPAAPASGTGIMPSTMPAGLPTPDNTGLPRLKYTVPAGWTEKAPSQMRVASFSVSDGGKNVDISVVPLGGMGGGDFANVNRWRGQVGLSPATDGDISQAAEKVDVSGTPASLYDLNGATERIIGVIDQRPEAVWFFKMTGDNDLTEKQKAAFIDFLHNVQFAEPDAAAAPPTMMDSQLPPSHPPIDSMTAPTMPADTAGAAPIPAWTVPAGWQPGPPSTFLVAKYIITAGDAQADVNISSSANDGGGLLPNVNRWRGQLGLPPVTDFTPDSLDLSDGKASVVDLSGTDARSGKSARIIGVVVPHNGQTWFYKLMGDPDIVSQQKAALNQFILSAKYPDAH